MKYDAFISYRHAELDRFAAENLHKKLEAFRLPKSIVRQRGKDNKKKIERVFRDRDELPLATNLADPITDALENSEFLIVICSPRLPQSLWCKKEIETFISMHGREHVLAVLIEGEPEESFPEELLYRERRITKEDGTVEVVKESVEPLAADVRGKTKKEILKKMDEELLRLTAAMFDCGYDDLKQRHKEQKMKKMLTMSLTASAVFLVFGAVSTTMAIRIQSQKEQIQAQSEEIRAKSEEIQAQKEEIEVQYQQALYNQALSMAEDSLELLEEGDRLEAMKVAYEALSVTEDGTSMPVTAEAQYALAESSYLYADGESLVPTYMFKHNANIVLMQESPNRERLLTADQYGTIYVWDVLTNKIIAQFAGDYLSYASVENCFFINDNQILYKGEKSFEIFDIETQAVVYTGEGNFYNGVSHHDQKYFAVVVNDSYQKKLQVYCTENLTLLQNYLIPENKSVGFAMTFDEEGETLVFVVEPGVFSDETESMIEAMDLESGEIIGEFLLESSMVQKLQVAEDVLYAGVSQSVDDVSSEGNNVLGLSYRTILYAIDLENMSQKWASRYDTGILGDFKINAGEYSRHLILSFYSEAYILNIDTGMSEHEFSFEDQIITTYYYAGNDYFAVITRKGDFHLVNGTEGESYTFAGYFQMNSNNLKQMLPVADGYVSLPYSDCNVTYYTLAEGEAYEIIYKQDRSIDEVYVNTEEDRAVVVCGGLYVAGRTIFLIDIETGNVLKEMPLEDTGSNIGIVNNKFFVFSAEMVSMFSVKDGSLCEEFALPEKIFPNYVTASTDGSALIFTSPYSIGKVDLQDGSYESISLDAFGENCVAEGISNDYKICAIANQEKKVIQLYHVGEEQAFAEVDAMAPLVSDLFFTKDNRYLFVYYLDKTAEIYDLESNTCVAEYDSFDWDLCSFTTLGEGEGYLILTISDGYLLNSNFELIARIPECAAIMPRTQKFIGINDSSLYTCPLYSTEQLLEKTEQILTELNAFR